LNESFQEEACYQLVWGLFCMGFEVFISFMVLSIDSTHASMDDLLYQVFTIDYSSLVFAKSVTALALV